MTSAKRVWEFENLLFHLDRITQMSLKVVGSIPIMFFVANNALYRCFKYRSGQSQCKDQVNSDYENTNKITNGLAEVKCSRSAKMARRSTCE